MYEGKLVNKGIISKADQVHQWLSEYGRYSSQTPEAIYTPVRTLKI